MPNLVVGRDYKVTIWCTLGNQGACNVRYFRYLGATGGTPTEQMAADGFSDLFGDDYGAALGNNANYYGVAFQWWSNPVVNAPCYSRVGTIGGSGGGDALPGQVSGIITLTTGLTGRTNRGRMYIPFPPEPASDDNAPPFPTPEYVALLEDIAGTFRGTQDIIDPANPGITMQFASELFRKSDFSFLAVNGTTVRKKFATQRKRGDYGAVNPPPF